MSDVTILARLIDGLTRNVDLSQNSLVVGSLKIGSANPVELTASILSNLISLQNGSDIESSLHHHDNRYWTRALIASTITGSSGASLVGVSGTPEFYTVTGSTVQDHLEGIDRNLKNVNRTVFKDSDFGIVNDPVDTKKLVFSTSAVSPNSTRTIYAADQDVNLADVNIAVLTTGTRPFTADQSMGGFKLTSVADGSNTGDAVNFGQLSLKVDKSVVGQAGGVASLDSGGKVPVSQLPNSIMEYQGVWDASSNQPFLTDGVGNTGDVYRVNIAGTHDFGSGNIQFTVGDYAVYNGAVWELSHSGSDAVRLVNGQAGIVLLTTSDIEEGSNLYFTDIRARTAAVVDTVSGLQTDQAPSIRAVDEALSTKQDASPFLDEAVTFFQNTDFSADQANTLISGQTADALHDHGQLKTVLNAGQNLNANVLQFVRFAVSGESAGSVYKADINTENGNKFWVVGAVAPTLPISVGGSVKVTIKGAISIGSGDVAFEAADIGKAIYLASSGSYSVTPPSAEGQAIVRLGYVQTTTSIWLDPGLHGIA
jgi:hypothetical protein